MSVAVDLPAYFARVGHEGDAAPTLANLQSIHARHVDAIPFENLAAFLGEPVPLDLASLQAKLLTPGRGGWCFEHNLFLSAVLEAMGYEVRRLAARVRWNIPPDVVTPRSHMLMRVRVAGEEYLADAGFGGLTLSAPLRLVADEEQATLHEPHRLLHQGGAYTLQAKVADEWATLYVFDLHEHQLADYEVSNWYLANNPRSQFVSGLIAARAEPGVRHALRNTRYAIHHAGGRTERRHLGSAAEFRSVLGDAFHIDVPATALFEEKIARTIAANPPGEL